MAKKELAVVLICKAVFHMEKEGFGGGTRNVWRYECVALTQRISECT